LGFIEGYLGASPGVLGAHLGRLRCAAADLFFLEFEISV
jgi:hypothetical protein